MVPPYAVAGKSNPHVPCFKIIFQITPEKTLTIDYIVRKERVSIRGTRDVIMRELDRLTALFGLISDVSAAKAVTSRPSPIADKPLSFVRKP